MTDNPVSEPEFDPLHCAGIAYLDMNVFVAMRTGEDETIRPVVEKLRGEGWIFPYSPAHLEEIAMVARTTDDEVESDKRVNANINDLAILSQHYAISQGSTEIDPTEIRRECPSDCMTRVLDQYHLTHLAEAIAEGVRSSLGDATALLPDVGTLEDPALQTRIQAKLAAHRVSPPRLATHTELLANHHNLQGTISTLFSILAEEGFAREKRKLTRSAIHDVTHATYGVMATILVTNDEKFRAKTRAVYKAIAVPTEVISSAEFVARFSAD